MDHADAQLHRLGRRIDADLLPAEIDVALRGLVQAEEDVHQGTLAGAVLAQERVDLPRPDVKIDVPVGVDVAEPLGDVFHPQNLFHPRLLSPVTAGHAPLRVYILLTS